MFKTNLLQKSIGVSFQIVLIILCLSIMGCTTTSSSLGGFSNASEQDMDPALRGRLDAAAEYLRKGNHRGARDHLKKALELDRSVAEIYDLLALLYYKELEYGLAEDNYRKAISLDRNFTRGLNNYGSFLYSRSRYTEAFDILSKASQDVDYNLRANVFYKLGLCNLRLGETARASEAFQKAIALNPRGVEVYLEVADLEYQVRNLPKAKQYLNYYSSLAPKASARSLWLGVRLEHLFENFDARESLGLALTKMFPNSTETLAYKEWVKDGYQ